MNKIKYVLFILIMFLSSIIVYAESDVVKDIIVKETGGEAIADVFSVDGNTITPDIYFLNENDSVSYQFTLNYDSLLYDIEDITDNNSNENVRLSHSYNDDKVFLTFLYDNKTNRILDNIELNVKLKGRNINPETGSVLLWIIISLYVLFVLFLFFKSTKKALKMLVFSIFFLPLLVFAKESNTITIIIDMSNIKFGYTVHFDSNEGTGTMDDIICYSNVECQLPQNDFQREDYVFIGWSTSSSGEIVYEDEDDPINITNEDEITLYAKWFYTIINLDYTGAVQTYTVTVPGRYKLEVWGAQGGGNYGGKGGYSYGTVSLTSNSQLYVYVGGAGVRKGTYQNSNDVGFNGGGALYGTFTRGSSGGGGTDIRINQDSLYARVIVAGGGGGGHADSDCSGGHGGGINGFSGNNTSAYLNVIVTTTSSYGPGGGGTQNSGGARGLYASTGYSYTNGSSTEQSSIGEFGQGGIGYGNGGSAGGGGWYGGGGGTAHGGGGGSGYVYTSSTASYYPSGCLLDESYYLTDAATIAGNTSFTSPGGGDETGHLGNGYARITYLGG